MSRQVRVTAPSRLHFGLWSLAGPGRQFGGVGAMIDRPGLVLEIAASARLIAEGLSAPRVLSFASRWAEFHRCEPPECSLRTVSAPQQHVGLGTGTQLALAVAAGLNAWSGLPAQTATELAISVGRGLRSAVGTHGFVHGGLIVEQGKLPGEPISPLDCRIDLPPDWRFVLVRPLQLAGLAGDDEAQAIASLPQIPAEVTRRLIAEAGERLVPAAATGDFPAFAESLYRYGNLSGQCFAARQGGPYNGQILTDLVERIRRLGFAGVGQSSWGPTVFVVAENLSSAERLARALRPSGDEHNIDLIVSAPCNTGARIEVIDSSVR